MSSQHQTLISIDPGRHSGIAVFINGTLEKAVGLRAHGPGFDGLSGLLYEAIRETFNTVPENTQIARVVCERMVFRPRDTRSNTDDLLQVTAFGGALVGALTSHLFRPLCRVSIEYVSADTWKGAVPKTIMAPRILGKLNETEKYSGRFDRDDHNVLDAVGVGLYALGRMRRGGV